MAYVGGIRVRLIADSFYAMLHDSLEALGWFDVGRQHLPINMIPEAVDNDTEVPLNTLAVVWTDTFSSEAELGSRFAEHRYVVYVDFYAEGDVLGMQVAHDVKAILEGRFPSIGRGDTEFPVYDYTMATPPQIFMCDIEDVSLDKANDFPRPWQRHWFSLRLNIIDYYGDEVY